MATVAKVSKGMNSAEYTYKDSFRHWWSRSSLQESEEAVLSLLPFYPESDGKRLAKVYNIPIDEKNKIHEFNVHNIVETNNKEDHVVLVHGYGAALGFFYKNFESLTERPNINLHALDLLGYGLSSRPNLPKHKKDPVQDVQQVEDFFIESIEKWRQYKKIDKFYLIGHSLGGYLCSLYTLKYPQHVSKLVLISPVGVERSIYDVTDSGNSESESLKEGPDIEQEVGSHFARVDETIKSSSLHVPDENGYVKRIPNFPKYLVYLWEKNVSPFSILRTAGPWGPQLSSRWSFRRFGKNIEDASEMMKLHIYSYNTFVARGSGEYALTRLLAPGALARYPLLQRVPQNLEVNSLWLYGDVDWMSKEAGKTMVNLINKKGDVKADYEIISGAGHHIYLDNPVDFKKSIYNFFGW